MQLCKQLKYERSIQPGKAVFFYKTKDSEFVPLEADIKRIRGQKTSISEAYASIGKPKNVAVQDLAYSNLIRMETVTVPPLVEAIYCRFNLRVFANSLEPSVCDDLDTHNILKQLANGYREKEGYEELAKRYAKNLLLGQWLFRNQQTYPVSIELLTSNNSIFSVNDVHQFDWNSRSNSYINQVEKLAGELAGAFSEPRRYWSAEVTAKISAQMGEEIFPSQQLTEKAEKGEISKLFSKLAMPDGREAVILNMEKVGAGIQMIDDWFTDGADYRLRVHEYGADPKHVIAQRRPEKHSDFYSLVSQAEDHLEVLKQAVSSSDIPAEIHYVMSVLIKGGMFQRGKEG